MYDKSIKLIEMPEHNSISVCVYNEQSGIFELGERMGAEFEEAYMNGYNWDALISYYVATIEPDLVKEVGTDPEAGMFSAYMEYSQDNLIKMKQYETHIRTMLADEDKLMKFIKDNYEKIGWD